LEFLLAKLKDLDSKNNKDDPLILGKIFYPIYKRYIEDSQNELSFKDFKDLFIFLSLNSLEDKSFIRNFITNFMIHRQNSLSMADKKKILELVTNKKQNIIHIACLLDDFSASIYIENLVHIFSTVDETTGKIIYDPEFVKAFNSKDAEGNTLYALACSEKKKFLLKSLSCYNFIEKIKSL
jgi:hypothetical protein